MPDGAILGGQNGQEGCEVVDGILLAHTVVGPIAKGQEVLGVLLVLRSLSAEAIGIELLGVGPALQQVSKLRLCAALQVWVVDLSRDPWVKVSCISGRPSRCRRSCAACLLMIQHARQLWLQTARLHVGCDDGGHEQGALGSRVRVADLEGTLAQLQARHSLSA